MMPGMVPNGMRMIRPNEEQKRVTSTGQWEDVERPFSQTLLHGLLRFLQILVILASVYLWSFTASEYRDLSGRLVDIMRGGVFFATAITSGYVFILIRRDVDMDGKTTGVIVIALIIVLLIFNVLLSPVIVFALVDMSWLHLATIILSAAAASFVPSFEVGRLSFWRELLTQPEASSEKPVIDATSVLLKQMDFDHEDERRNAAPELAEANDRIKALEAEITRLQSQPAAVRLVPLNHGSAHRIGDTDFKGDDYELLARYIQGWDARGTTRDPWITQAAKEKYGWVITKPQWEHFRDALRSVGILDSHNMPTCAQSDALRAIGYPPAPRENSGNGKSGA